MGLLLALILKLLLAPAVEVQVRPKLALVPTDVRVVVRIDPHPENRQLTIVLVSANFYRSSTLPLEGADAPKILERTYEQVRAPGMYEVVVVLLRSTGARHQAREELCLIGPDAPCESPAQSQR